VRQRRRHPNQTPTPKKQPESARVLAQEHQHQHEGRADRRRGTNTMQRLVCAKIAIAESTVRIFVAQVQEQQRLAEAVGGVDFVLFVLLQGMHGRLPASVAATFGLHGGAAGGRRRHRQGLRLQVAIQKSRVLLPSRVRVHLQQVSCTGFCDGR
jgi:hypothetical protein